MLQERCCGILCHPTSFPSPFGIGDLGEEGYRFIDFLVEAGQSIWQVLPLGPTGYGDSPYQSFSAFAGNPLLIDLRPLVEEGLLEKGDLALAKPFPQACVPYGEVIAFKHHALRTAFERLRQASPDFLDAWDAFRQRHHTWLDDYALFMALKQRYAWAAWVDWPPALALREETALERAREELAQEIAYHAFLQFLFERQWQRLRAYANEKGIRIVGDVPIFVGHDSADVWSRQDLFYLDERGHPLVIAGVPPDYFSPTGQRWGNPLYRWDRMAEQGFAWWIERFRRAFQHVDVVRIDHFRGFVAYWEIPAEEETAINGRWVPGPGKAFFEAVSQTLGELPIIAEDLGLITEDVIALRKALGFPGMVVLQFAFAGDSTNPHLPFNHERNSVVYTGTHDNDTTVGWYANLDEEQRHRIRVYTGSDDRDIHWKMIRLAMTSVARWSIYPLQDVLGLGSQARMNFPGRAQGNWAWRYLPDALSPALAVALAEVAWVAGRHPAERRSASTSVNWEKGD